MIVFVNLQHSSYAIYSKDKNGERLIAKTPGLYYTSDKIPGYSSLTYVKDNIPEINKRLLIMKFFQAAETR